MTSKAKTAAIGATVILVGVYGGISAAATTTPPSEPPAGGGAEISG